MSEDRPTPTPSLLQENKNENERKKRRRNNKLKKAVSHVLIFIYSSSTLPWDYEDAPANFPSEQFSFLEVRTQGFGRSINVLAKVAATSV